MRATPASCLALLLLAAHAPCQRVADGVEAHVRAAFERAWSRLPAPWSEQLADVVLERTPTLGVPEHAPMSLRLLDRATLAFFSNVPRRIAVTDAGARMRPQWGLQAPTREQVATFLLDELGYATDGARDAAVDIAWARFVASVYGWRDEQAPEPVPAVGAVAVLDRFLEHGVQRSLGGTVPLEQLLFHELAHAVQNDLRRMPAHMAMWGSLSGWRECADESVADGYSGGMFAIEQPIVLIRILLDRPRGPCTYAPHGAARFVNHYARFDLREDFAECARLMAYDPDALLRLAPTKFLYLNALGWSTRLDAQTVGPLWLDGDWLAHERRRAHVVTGAARLLAHDPATPIPNPLAVAAILRAHASLLRTADLPQAHRPVEAPSDLPPELRAQLATERFTFTIEGVARQPAPGGIVARWDDELVRWIDHREYTAGFEQLLGANAEELRARHRDRVLAASDPDVREREFEQLLVAIGDALPEAERQRLCLGEAGYHADNRRPLVAARYRLMAGHDTREDLAAAARRLADSGRTDFAAVELQAAIAAAFAAAGDHAAARTAVDAIPGTSWGAVRRVELLLRIGATEQAERCAAAVTLPQLRTRLLDRARKR